MPPTKSLVPVTPGDGDKKVATYSIEEDGDTKELQRQVPSNSTGDEIKPLAVASGIGDGSKVVTAAGTAVQLTSTPTPCKSVIIAAKAANTGVIAVGGSTVDADASARRGIPLSADDTISLDIDDVSKVYIDSTVNGEGVTYLYLT